MSDPFIHQLFRSPWTGAPARGALPQVPQSATLPTADANREGQLTWAKGDGSTTPSALYICLESATGTYSWVEVAHG